MGFLESKLDDSGIDLHKQFNAYLVPAVFGGLPGFAVEITQGDNKSYFYFPTSNKENIRTFSDYLKQKNAALVEVYNSTIKFAPGFVEGNLTLDKLSAILIEMSRDADCCFK